MPTKSNIIRLKALVKKGAQPEHNRKGCKRLRGKKDCKLSHSRKLDIKVTVQ